MIMMAITQAKIGRFMKNFGMEQLLYFFAAGAAAGAGAAADGTAGALSNGTALTGVPRRAF
jgi:hypothetical protein